MIIMKIIMKITSIMKIIMKIIMMIIIKIIMMIIIKSKRSLKSNQQTKKNRKPFIERGHISKNKKKKWG